MFMIILGQVLRKKIFALLMLPENYYEKQRERSRLNYHRNKELYREKYEKRREKCVAYMKHYNKEYYQEHREEILEKNKASGAELRVRAEYKKRNIRIPTTTSKEPVIVKVDPAIFTIMFDD